MKPAAQEELGKVPCNDISHVRSILLPLVKVTGYQLNCISLETCKKSVRRGGGGGGGLSFTLKHLLDHFKEFRCLPHCIVIETGKKNQISLTF